MHFLKRVHAARNALEGVEKIERERERERERGMLRERHGLLIYSVFFIVCRNLRNPNREQRRAERERDGYRIRRRRAFVRK